MDQSRDSINNICGDRTPYFEKWPTRIDERTETTPDHWVQSACVPCPHGCGMEVGGKDGRHGSVPRRAGDPANHGRLGPKGLHGWEANNSKDRLTKPLIRKNNKLVEASWDEAMQLIV